jgi:outer membrane protein assembly factor BamD
MISEYLGTSFREEALFYKFKSSYELGMRSTLRKKGDRLNSAIKAFEKLQRNYPNSDFLKESKKLLKQIKQEQKIVNS